MMKSFLKWIFLSVLVGLFVGVLAFAFHVSIAKAISFRKSHDWLIYLLPFVGLLVAHTYQKYGKDVDSGNKLILDEIHEPKKHILFRMVPMIFISSVLSHLFGASVGREGAAVQIGAGTSDQFSKFAGTFFNNRKIVLMTGMSAGFAAIFGTPLAATVFGIEVLVHGETPYFAIIPCLIAAYVGHLTAQSIGIEHAQYPIIATQIFSLTTITSVILSGILFGLIARVFLWGLHSAKKMIAIKINNPIYRPVLGGIIIIFIFLYTGSDRYLSLGEEVMHLSFVQKINIWDFAAKIFSTISSVGSGFKGGEVMALFYIGATFGNTLSLVIPLTFPFLSALGFVSVFSGAANTPIAGILLAVELFGFKLGCYAIIAVFFSYLFSGQSGLYSHERKHFLLRL